ncbi:MAG: hypothetical protein JKX68_05270 [Flavobacteriales bacterium]|nr:hypothetical protein [Flavobacteriales bacterium]
MKSITTKIIFGIILIFCFSTGSYAQTNDGNYIITMDGDSIIIYGDKVTVDPSFIYYINDEGKRKGAKHRHTKMLHVSGTYFLRFAKDTKKDDLYRVVAFNDKYILGAYVGDKTIVLNDRNLNSVVKAKYYNIYNKDVSGRYKKLFDETIGKYFIECPGLIEAISKNIFDATPIATGINYYNCGNAPDLITNKVESIISESQENIDNEEEKEVADDKSKSFGITNEGEKIMFASPAALNSRGKFNYQLKEQKIGGYKASNTSKFKLIVNNDRLYIKLNVNTKRKYMMQVLSFNDKYILAGTWVGYSSKPAVNKCYIYDRDYNIIEGGVEKEDVSQLVKKYFSECQDLIEAVEDNVKNHRSLNFGINYYKCGEVPDLFQQNTVIYRD